MKKPHMREIYSRVPNVQCRRLCQQSCGPIQALRSEKRHFERRTGVSFPDPMQVLQTKTMRCPLLASDGRCSVYPDRPLICRLWGAVKAMTCPHGCEPERWLTDNEAGELIRLTR